MRLAPGWCLVTPVETEESYHGSPLIIPASVRDRVARFQAEVVQVPVTGAKCGDRDCVRPHAGGHHPLPGPVVPGAWVLLDPIPLTPHPDHLGWFFCPVEAIWGVFQTT